MSVIWSGVTAEGAVVPVQVTDEGKVVAVGDGPQGDYLPITGGTLTGDLNVADGISLKTDGNIKAKSIEGGENLATAADGYGFICSTNSTTRQGNIVVGSTSASQDVFSGFQGATRTSSWKADGTISLGGVVPTSPSITLSSNGSATFVGGVESESSFRATFPGQPTSIYAQHDSLIQYTSANDSTQAWSLSSNGSATFSGNVQVNGNPIQGAENGCLLRSQGTLHCSRKTGAVFVGNLTGVIDSTSVINSDGSAVFSGDVVIGSRGEKWLIRESNGVAMLVQQSREAAPMPVSPMIPEKVRDIPAELDLIEMALNEVMEKLRMTPPAGWPVWDGSDNP